MEEESNKKKFKKKMLVSQHDAPLKIEKSCDDLVKIPTNTSDEESAERQKQIRQQKLAKETAMNSKRSVRKIKTKKKDSGVPAGMSVYSKVKEPSKRGLHQSKKNVKQRQKQKSNDAVIRTLYSRAKNRLNRGKNQRNQEAFMCPDEISKQIDVPDEYGGDMIKEKTIIDPEVSAVSGLFPMNNENNGNLFTKGVPFWCLKDDKPPTVNYVGISTTLEAMIDKKFILLKELPEPNNLDPFNELNIMTNRDEEYFKTNNRILSNTVRSLVGTNDVKKTSDVRAPNLSSRHAVLGFQMPTIMHVYNRKNRFEPMTTVNFTQGALAKKKKGIFAHLIDHFY